jgi:AcrR family transcriptional regulator
MPGRARRVPYHHGDLRQALVREGAALVAREGHLAISVREVARAVGVSHTAAFHHFATREVLLAAIAARGFDALTAALERAYRGSSPQLDRFGRLGRCYVRHALAHARMYQLMFGAETADRDVFEGLREAVARTFAVLVDAVRDAQAAGLVEAGPPIDRALAAWATVHGLTSLWIDGQLDAPGLRGRSAAELIAVVLGLSYRGLRPARGARRVTRKQRAPTPR